MLSLLNVPGSATSVAPKLGIARQKANYHLRELEQAGFVRLVEERKRGNCTERLVRASAEAYVISPDALGALSCEPDRVRDRFSVEYLIALAARLIRELSALLTKIGSDARAAPTLSLETLIRFRSPQERAEFARDLANRLAELIAKYHDANGPEEPFRLVMAVHPSQAEPKLGAEEGTP
jgi:DNA-binding transcriptional ArsR family regulator